MIVGVLVLVFIVSALFFSLSETQLPEGTEQATQIDLSLFANGQDIFITADDLHKRLGDDNLVILDGNHPKLYAKGHIPEAINIGFKGLSRAEGKPGDAEWGTILPRQELQKRLESYGITNDSLIVCYSDTLQGPGADGRAVWQLRMAGLDKVKLLYGGMALWRQAGYQLTDEPPKSVPPSTGLVLQDYQESYRANRHSILENIDTLKLIDVRSKKEFTGEDTSRGEARGGHIKNAQWLEWKELLKPDGSPKSAVEIIALLAGVGVRPDDDVIVY
jgi:thiosulfate/3-mercaptopyruvate sulfurtransferase